MCGAGLWCGLLVILSRQMLVSNMKLELCMLNGRRIVSVIKSPDFQALIIEIWKTFREGGCSKLYSNLTAPPLYWDQICSSCKDHKIDGHTQWKYFNERKMFSTEILLTNFISETQKCNKIYLISFETLSFQFKDIHSFSWHNILRITKVHWQVSKWVHNNNNIYLINLWNTSRCCGVAETQKHQTDLNC